MTKLALFLLGRPQFFLDGVEVTSFNTRKDQALLAYLAMTGSLNSRETLANLLWSELPEDKARRNLRHSLTHLQKVIGPQWLSTERGVGLTQAHPWSVDVHLLHKTVKNLPHHTNGAAQHAAPQELDALSQALQLYRGEFLQGFHLHDAALFDEWVLAQREESRLLTLHGLEVLAKRCLAQNAYEQGLVAIRRLLQLEPWSEPAYCLQMKLLAQSGRRSEALAQYERCRQILADELGVEPLPETTALYRQILNRQANSALTLGNGIVQRTPTPAETDQHPQVDAQPTANTIVKGKAPAPNNLLTPLAVFVGRQSELALISGRLADDNCRLLTIVGPGGMGKTSLAQAAAQNILQTRSADFPDGIFFVSLLSIGTPADVQNKPALTEDPIASDLILRAIAEQIDYRLEAGVPTVSQLQTYLRPRQLLLILDNFEHLLVGTSAVINLLAHAPQLKMLITSRARLNVRGETVLTLDKLSLPTTIDHAANAAAQTNLPSTIQADTWQTSEAIAMFVQRAQQFNPHFTINGETIGPVAQICQLVDGLPLGIELATSMLPMLNYRALAAELAQRLDFLVTDMR